MSEGPVPTVSAEDHAALVSRRLEQVRDLLVRNGADGVLLDARDAS